MAAISMSLKILTEAQISSLLDRFGYFGDAVIESVEFRCGRLFPRCVLTVAAIDGHAADLVSFRRVILQMEHVVGFQWPSDWMGSVDGGQLRVFTLSNSVILALVDESEAALLRREDCYKGRSMFIEGGKLLYEIGERIESWRLSAKYSPRQCVRISERAPDRFHPGAAAAVWGARILEQPEEDEHGTIARGVWLYEVQLEGGQMLEIPEEFLVPCEAEERID